MIFNNISQGD